MAQLRLVSSSSIGNAGDAKGVSSCATAIDRVTRLILGSQKMFIRNDEHARASKSVLKSRSNKTDGKPSSRHITVMAGFYENPLKSKGGVPTSSNNFAERQFRVFCKQRGTTTWNVDLDAELVRWVTEKTRTLRIKPTELLAMEFACNKDGVKGGVAWDLLRPKNTKELDAYPVLRQRFDSENSVTFQRHLKNRYVELCLLNGYVKKALPFVPIASIGTEGNLSISTTKTSLLELFSNARHIIFDAVKTTLWEQGMESTLVDGACDKIKLVLRRSLDYLDNPTQKVPHTHTFFGQAFERLHPLPPERLRYKAQLWDVVLAGFRSHDAGGPYRESFSLICQDLQSHRLHLFVKTPNNAQNVGTMRDAWVPNPAATDHLSLEMFKFVGKLMGIAIRNKEYLSLSLAPLVWSKIVGSPVTYDVLKKSHQALCLAMEHMSGWHETSNANPAKPPPLPVSARSAKSPPADAADASPCTSAEEVPTDTNTPKDEHVDSVTMRRVYSRGI